MLIVTPIIGVPMSVRIIPKKLYPPRKRTAQCLVIEAVIWVANVASSFAYNRYQNLPI